VWYFRVGAGAGACVRIAGKVLSGGGSVVLVSLEDIASVG
jgi:hypothetical protein